MNKGSVVMTQETGLGICGWCVYNAGFDELSGRGRVCTWNGRERCIFGKVIKCSEFAAYKNGDANENGCYVGVNDMDKRSDMCRKSLSGQSFVLDSLNRIDMTNDERIKENHRMAISFLMKQLEEERKALFLHVTWVDILKGGCDINEEEVQHEIKETEEKIQELIKQISQTKMLIRWSQDIVDERKGSLFDKSIKNN